jgi:hypothetical protein
VYDAPEVGQLLAATGPVQSVSASLGGDLGSAARALDTYAAEVREIKARLDALRVDASAFTQSVQGDEDWAGDDAKRERNNQLIDAVNLAVADFQAAQRRCANAINGLYGGPQYRVDDGDGQRDSDEYGNTAEQYAAAAGGDEGLPWGKTETDDPGLFSSIGHGILDVAGLVPVIGEAADGANAAWYAAEGDALNASLSAAAMVPFLGWGATGAKVSIKGAKALKGAETLKGADEITAGRQFVTTPRGTTFDIPAGWQSRTADNGKGIVFQRPGAVGNADSIRIMEPNAQYPNGRFMHYNSSGQPLDINGKPGPKSATHIPEDFAGKIKDWPK